MTYVSAPEARAMLGGICHATLHLWLKNNPEMPRPIKVGGPRGKRFFRVDELQAFMEKNRVEV